MRETVTITNLENEQTTTLNNLNRLIIYIQFIIKKRQMINENNVKENVYLKIVIKNINI